VYLLAEAAARHEHQPLAQLGELVGELHDDAAAQRVSTKVARSRSRVTSRSRMPLAWEPSE